MIRNAVATCEYCRGPILRGAAVEGKRLRHCSHKCKSAATRKIAPEALREAVLAGKTVTAMAAEFQVYPATIRKWLEIDGLLSEWRRRRFKKCAVAA